VGQLQAAGAAGVVLATGVVGGVAVAAGVVDLRAGAFAVCAEAACVRRSGVRERARRRVQGPMRMVVPLTGRLLFEAVDFNRMVVM